MLLYASIPTAPLVVPSFVGMTLSSLVCFFSVELGIMGFAICAPGFAVGMGLMGLYYAGSRMHESEADYIGLRIMASSGYGKLLQHSVSAEIYQLTQLSDIREAPKFWERMQVADEKLKEELEKQGYMIVENSLTSTHPHASSIPVPFLFVRIADIWTASGKIKAD